MPCLKQAAYYILVVNESTSSGLVKVPHNWVIKMDVVSAQFEERWRTDGLRLMKGLCSGGLLGWQELTRVLPIFGEEHAGQQLGGGHFLLGDSREGHLWAKKQVST